MRAAPGKRGRAGFREVAGARSQDVLLIRNTVGARMEIESGMLSENRLVFTCGNHPWAWSKGLSAVLC